MLDVPLPESVSGCRALARQLLRRFRTGDPAAATAAAHRFLRLRTFAAESAEELCRSRARVRLKHALTVVALEHGFGSWLELKAAAELREAAASARPAGGGGTNPAIGAVDMYTPRLATLLNRWFADYAEARSSLEAEGGFLLPYRAQFFITESEGIRELGLDPDDDDWARIGWDWVRPADAAAHGRLFAKRRDALGEGEAPAGGCAWFLRPSRWTPRTEPPDTGNHDHEQP